MIRSKDNALFLQKGMKMSKKAKLLMLALGTLLFAETSSAAVDAKKKESASENENVLFKIHDIIPEKNSDGKVLYCNIGATFFNRTSADISNASLNLVWDDEVISDTIDQEERAEKEYKRTNSRAERSRYSTAGFTDKVVKLSLKLPPLKAGQQVSLKTKVLTDRCFLLLNDMDINVSNCGTATMSDKISRGGCSNLFHYVSPKMPEYYMEFKQQSLDEQIASEDNELAEIQKEMETVFDDTVTTIREIVADVSDTNKVEDDDF